jgi:LPS sulfotransferase NodH
MMAENPDRRTENARQYKDGLRSAEWDVGDGTPTRFRYAIFSTPRSGSELLCAYLRKHGIGVPMEYFGLQNLAERLGCLKSDGRTWIPLYLQRLEAARTTPNGIFGTKLHPGQLKIVSNESVERATAFLGHFDRIIVLRRRDHVLQAISLARANFTGQFHIFAGDEPRPVQESDDVLFAQVAWILGDIQRTEHYAATILSRIEPRKIQALWYEDFSESLFASLAASLRSEAGAPAEVSPGNTVLQKEHILPRKGDSREAHAIKERFLAHVAGKPSARDTRAG